MKIEHIAIWVSDLDLIKDFYQKYFAKKQVEKNIKFIIIDSVGMASEVTDSFHGLAHLIFLIKTIFLAQMIIFIYFV